MKYIDKKELDIKELIYDTINTQIFNVTYNNKKYILKNKNDKIYSNKKIKLLSNINDKNIITPKYIVKENNKTVGYLSNYIKGETIAHSNLDYNDKIYYLKKTKEIIEKLHYKYNIIHGDLHGGNIIINNKNVFLIDFDNCNINEYYIKKKYCLEQVEKYIDNFGINYNLDIFTFNITTYSILYNCPFQLVRRNIYQENYGFNNSPKVKKICKDLLLENNNINNEYLIDYIK